MVEKRSATPEDGSNRKRAKGDEEAVPAPPKPVREPVDRTKVS